MRPGFLKKLLFGSDYPYRGAGPHLGVTNEQVGLRASLAMGGLSTVWGSAMLPYNAGDILAWPIAATLLEPHYRAVSRTDWSKILQKDHDPVVREIKPGRAAADVNSLPHNARSNHVDQYDSNSGSLSGKTTRQTRAG
jgi:hypothetical protein